MPIYSHKLKGSKASVAQCLIAACLTSFEWLQFIFDDAKQRIASVGVCQLCLHYYMCLRVLLMLSCNLMQCTSACCPIFEQGHTLVQLAYFTCQLDASFYVCSGLEPHLSTRTWQLESHLILVVQTTTTLCQSSSD